VSRVRTGEPSPRARRADSARPPAPAEAAGERVAAGRVVAPHGIRGELAVEVFSDVPGRLDAGASLLLTVPGTPPVPVTIAAARPHKGRLLLRLVGVDDRDGAEALRGALLEVPESEVPPAPEGSWYWYELVGCRCVERAGGRDLGAVAEVLEGGGGLLLRVEGAQGELLLPFVESYLAEVDTAGRRIVWDLPEGFLEELGGGR
jgi:16S rRNA processing protein RimM